MRLPLLCCSNALRYVASQGDETALHSAAINGKLEVARLLLADGADQEAKDKVPRRCLSTIALLL